MNRKFEDNDRVRIIKQEGRYHLVDQAYVVDYGDDGRPIVEYIFKFLKHIESFEEDELEHKTI